MSKYAKMVWDGENLIVPAEMGTPQPHHLLSTPLDNLIELSGRVCYDSLKIKKSRSSPDYHKHIAEVGHGSVQEHANFTCLIPRWYYNDNPGKEIELLKIFLNRPGIFIRESAYGLRLTLNIRSAVDWDRHNKYFCTSISKRLGSELKNIASCVCPMAVFDTVYSDEKLLELVKPETEEEIWVSFYLMNVSRGLTHELVRHGDWTGISQRSTRYVDEHESNWAWHPLIEMWERHGGDSSLFKESEALAKKAYGTCLLGLEEFIKSRGADKFTARKQARGASRGVLGNALATELIFSASLSQWKWILRLRASDPADAEIRVAMVEVFNCLKEKFPDNFKNWSLAKASDGIGEVVVETPQEIPDVRANS